MPENEILAPISDDDLRRGGLPDNMKMAPGLAIYFVDALYARCKAVALRMSEAKGMVGPHLINNPGACMAIISRSITWNLDPFAVAQATYEVKGKIGYLGSLCQAILENSGSIEGQLKFEFFGDWDKLRGKFKMTGAVGSGERKPQQLWTDEDEIGLGVKVSSQVKGETGRREEEFFLAEMQPRNSTLWILRPKQQMRYSTARAYGNIAVPGIFMGIPFDVDPSGMGEGQMRDVTPPKPQASEFTSVRDQPQLQGWITKANFANTLAEVATLRKEGLEALPEDQRQAFEEVCDARGRQIAASAPVTQEEENVIREAAMDSLASQEGMPNPFQGDEVGSVPNIKKQKEETPFQRGVRLLGVVKAAADVRDVLDTISEELRGKELKLWKDTCQARYIELGGVGKMKTAP